MSSESETGLRAGMGDVPAAMVGVAMLAFARRWARGPRVAVLRMAIAGEAALLEAGETRSKDERAVAFEHGILTMLAIATLALERQG
jgi:hypothetical protein